MDRIQSFRFLPALIPPLLLFSACYEDVVSAGIQHTCRTEGGDAFCWGSNRAGQLGDGTNTSSNVPVAVAGSFTFRQVSAGAWHSCGVTRTDQALCWGSNSAGELGDATNTTSNVPVAVVGGFSFTQVSAGSGYTCGITPAAQALCWGDNFAGQLGDGTKTSHNVPVAVAGGYSFSQVSAGSEEGPENHTCGITKAGQALCWGYNSIGQLGDGTNTDSNVPVAVAGGFSFVEVSAGAFHTCGLTEGGQALCWGYNVATGALGDGTYTDSNVPVAVAGGYSFRRVSAGAGHTCAITTAGQAFCWGRNSYGQLGDVTYTWSNVPVAVGGGHTFRRVDAGGRHTCGITQGGIIQAAQALCWGQNEYGQLGIGSTTNSPIPSPVAMP